LTEGLKEVPVSRLEFEAFKELMNERDKRYEQRADSTDERTSLALTASEKAVAKAETATEKRFDAVNEFRGQLKDQAATLMPRAEADSKFLSMTKEIEELKKSANTAQGRSSGFSASWGIVVSLMLIGIALIGLLLRGKP
jgi:hypothetical protein